MPDESDQAAVDKRATWVALRTLRQRPKVVDHQKNGEPIYEIRSVRLVLRDNFDHFNRLAQCSKCGRELPGAPVLTQADLTRPSHSVLCKECVRKATDRSQRVAGARREVAPKPQAAESSESETPAVDAPAPREADDGRLALIESRLTDVLTQLEVLADAQRQEGVERRQADDDVQGRLQEALVRGLDGIRADLVSLNEGDSPDQQHGSAALTAALAETRAELQRLVESNRQLALGQQQADRRLEEVTKYLEAQPATSDVAAALRGEIAEAEARLAGSAASDRTELQLALRDGLAIVRREVASLEEQLRATADALPQLVERQRSQTGTVKVDRMEQQLATVAESVRRLTSAQDDLERTVGGLLDDALKTEMRVSALSSLADAGTRRLETLEQGISQALVRLTALVEHRRDIPSARVEKDELDKVTMGEESTTQWADGPPDSGTLLDALDRQLREAEMRLALHVSASHPGLTRGSG